MTTDTSNPADAGEGEADADPDSDNPWKAQAMAARKQRDAEKAKRREMQSRIDAFEAKEREIEDEKARAAQDWQKAEKLLRGDYDKRIKDLSDRVAEYEQKEQAAIKAKRFGSFTDMVIAQAGLPADAKALVEGLLLREEREGADVAPEENAEAAAKAMAKKLRSRAPSLFTAKSVGPNGTPGVPQGGDPSLDESELARVQKLAAMYSGRGG